MTSVEQKLASDKFVVNEGNPHIIPNEKRMDEEMKKSLTVGCPAGLYALSDDNRLVFEFAGCLECGTCRVICARLQGALEWNHPRATFGVQFRYG